MYFRRNPIPKTNTKRIRPIIYFRSQKPNQFRHSFRPPNEIQSKGAAPKFPFMEGSDPVANPAAGWGSDPVANPAAGWGSDPVANPAVFLTTFIFFLKCRNDIDFRLFFSRCILVENVPDSYIG